MPSSAAAAAEPITSIHFSRAGMDGLGYRGEGEDGVVYGEGTGWKQSNTVVDKCKPASSRYSHSFWASRSEATTEMQVAWKRDVVQHSCEA